MTNISHDVVLHYLDNFFGHGNLKSQLWFIGKEHGGDNTFQSKIQRFMAWDKLGRGYTIDSSKFGTYMAGHDKWQKTGRIQATWGKLIQFILAYNDSEYGREAVSNFQLSSLGLDDSNHCILELMPLAAKSKNDWIYAEHLSAIDFLKDRETYFRVLAPKRAHVLRTLVHQFQPAVVLFYSTDSDYLPYWNLIADVENWHEIEIRPGFKVKMAQSGASIFLITPHPTRHGIKGEDFPSLARLVKSL